jgi:hypothetical protein
LSSDDAGQEVLGDDRGVTALERLGTRLRGRLRGRLARHRTLLPVGAGVLVAVGVGVAAFVLVRQHADDPGADLALSGVSISAQHPGAITGTYDVAMGDQGAGLVVNRVVGPLIRSSSGASRGGTDGAESLTVTALPDCTSPASLDRPSERYYLDLTRTGFDGRAEGLRIAAPTDLVDWGAALSRECWRQLASLELTPLTVRATVADGGRLVLLDVTLRNGLGRDVQVQVVDVAEAAALDAADSGVLGQGSQRTFSVRLPVPDCAASVPTELLSWSVGPVGGDPTAVVSTALSPEQASTVRTAVRAARPVRCS